MKHRIPTLFCMALALGASACQSTPEAATSALLGAAGAYIGSEIADGEPEGALLGAAAGVAAGVVVNHWQESAEKDAYLDGYDRGRNDEVKRLYWASKRLHNAELYGRGPSDGLERSYYEVPVPAHVAGDGVIIEGHRQVIEIVE
jgi:hypothetical protein